jgi:hypothetical protein
MAKTAQRYVVWGQIPQLRKVFFHWLEACQHCEQGWVRQRLHDQPVPFSADDGFISRKLELTWNPQRLISPVLE